MASTEGNIENAKTLEKKVLHTEKWLSLQLIKYQDARGTIRSWETCERTTAKQGQICGVDILATVKFKDGSPDCIILERQYRPPLDRPSIEFPAGLLDPNETPQVAALRELKEETGYDGNVTSVSPALSLEPGMSSALTCVVHVDVTAENQSDRPKQHLEESEFIEVLLIPVNKFYEQLLELSKTNVVDAKVYTYALALHATRQNSNQ